MVQCTSVPWYTVVYCTMVKSTMVFWGGIFYHGIPWYSVPWYTVVLYHGITWYHGIFCMVYHGSFLVGIDVVMYLCCFTLRDVHMLTGLCSSSAST